MLRIIGKLSTCLVLAAALSACSSDSTSVGATATRAAVVANYSANLSAAYADSVTDETAFKASIDAFLASPSDDTLAAARKSWIDTRAHYMLTEGARFYDGPIDVDPPNHEALINSWPLDESYIDYTTDAKTGAVDETVGIVNRPDVLKDITSDGLDLLNATESDTSISSGYHAVEFLLWGQALKDVGPGERPFTDYVTDGGRKNVDRRTAFLRVAVDGILLHLNAVNDAWAKDADYRSKFNADPDGALTKIFTGLAKFSKGELAGQRINAAYVSKARRDQHDCFSSDTLIDYERDARGVQNLYLGVYGSNTTGPGLDSLVKAVDAELDAKIKTAIQASIDAVVAIPKPFEASIVGDDTAPGRVAIRAAVNSLRAQGDLFGQAASALGLTIEVDDPAAP